MAGQLSPELRLSRLRRVGLMALLSLSLVLVVLSWWSLRLASSPRVRYVVRPEQPVFGISVGSPVRLRGVWIGEVCALGLWRDPANGRFRPEIGISLDPRRADGLEELAAWTSEGLRVEFVPVNPASGFLEIDLVWRPSSPQARATVEQDELPTLPARGSGLGRAAGVLQSLAGADPARLARELEVELDDILAAWDRPSEHAASLAATAADLRLIAERLESSAGAEALALDHARLAEARERLLQLGQALGVAAEATAESSRQLPASLAALGRRLRELAGAVGERVPPDSARR